MFGKRQVVIMITISYCFAAFVAILLAKNFANLTTSQIGEELGIVIFALAAPFFIILFNRITADLIDEEDDEMEYEEMETSLLDKLADIVFYDSEYDN